MFEVPGLLHKNKKACNHLRKEDAIYGGRRVELRGVQYILLIPSLPRTIIHCGRPTYLTQAALSSSKSSSTGRQAACLSPRRLRTRTMIRSLVRILAAPGSGNCSIVTNTLVLTENDGKTRVGCQGKLFLGWCKYK